MSIDYDRFLDWAESRFDSVIVSGAEIKLNSIFCDDRKHHLWCNPSGGKKGYEAGVYHCWKSDQKGSLVGLVMRVDGCTYDEAMRTLDLAPGGRLADLEKRVEEIFESKRAGAGTEPSQIRASIEMPPDCYPFDDLPTGHKLRARAAEYLSSRMIPTDGLTVCTSGKYRNRIVIPYLDRSGTLIYYNGRYVGDGDGLRYLGPPKELGIGKGDVLYSRNWPSRGDKVYITEGEFDSMSLDISGFKSVALGGKSMTPVQMEMIRGCLPVLSLDADDSGGAATPRLASMLIKAGFNRVRYVRPSREYKDWNGLLVARGPRVLAMYVDSQERDYETLSGGDWEGTRLGLNGMFP
jgi:hypothetical protein